MKEINQKLLDIRQHLNLNQTIFGYNLGVSRSVIQNIESDKTSPNKEFLHLVCKIYSVNENWLLYGTGDMFLDQMTAELNSLSDKYNLSQIETSILRNYLSMDIDARQIFSEVLIKLSSNIEPN